MQHGLMASPPFNPSNDSMMGLQQLADEGNAVAEKALNDYKNQPSGVYVAPTPNAWQSPKRDTWQINPGYIQQLNSNPMMGDDHPFKVIPHNIPPEALTLHHSPAEDAMWKGRQPIQLKQADNYQQDTRNFPDPTEPRASNPPVPDGCTCPLGHKLDCPVHGLHGTQDDLDNQWANKQQANPIGFAQDATQSWQQAYSNIARLYVYDPNQVSKIADIHGGYGLCLFTSYSTQPLVRISDIYSNEWFNASVKSNTKCHNCSDTINRKPNPASDTKSSIQENYREVSDELARPKYSIDHWSNDSTLAKLHQGQSQSQKSPSKLKSALDKIAAHTRS